MSWNRENAAAEQILLGQLDLEQKKVSYRIEEEPCLLLFMTELSTKSSNPQVHFLVFDLQLQAVLDELLFSSLKTKNLYFI